MNYLPLSIVAYHIKRWIASCETYQQLATMENLIDRYILVRSEDAGFDICLKVLKQDLQMQQIRLQNEERVLRINKLRDCINIIKRKRK